MTIRKHVCRIFALALAIAIQLTSCNKKTEEPENTYNPASNVALTGFSLKAYPEVAANLDSVYFAIDLRKAEVFNADSLPVGTVISNLVPVLTYPSTVKAVQIEAANGVFDYIASPGTGMDMSDGLKITLTSADGLTSRTYNVKINVHRQNPSAFLWNQDKIGTLPGAESPIDQKTLIFKGEALCYTIGIDNSLYLSRASAQSRSWQTEMLDLLFKPHLRTMAAGEENLFVLSDSGELFTSPDGISWTSTGKIWQSITGAYLGSVTGIAASGDNYIHTAWPEGSLPETPMEADFPLEGFTNSGTVTTPWSPWPTMILYGGVKQDNGISDATWGFDGERWSIISSNQGPAIYGATLVPYWLARKTSTSWITDDRDAWLLIGGTDADGEANSRIWYSFDNGVNWTMGPEEMSLPENGATIINADALVDIEARSASALDWAKARRRMNVKVEGTEILWECPIIYFFGGKDPRVNHPFVDTDIRRGALAKFTFIPLI